MFELSFFELIKLIDFLADTMYVTLFLGFLPNLSPFDKILNVPKFLIFKVSVLTNCFNISIKLSIINKE